MLLPLVVLGILSVVGGGSGKWFEEMNPKLSALQQLEGFSRAGVHSELIDQALFKPSSKKTPASAAIPLERELEENTHAQEHDLRHMAHETAMKWSLLLGLGGMLVAFLFYWEKKDGRTILNPCGVAQSFPLTYALLLRKYFIDEIYWILFLVPVRALSFFWARFDRMFIDSVVNALADLGRDSSQLMAGVDKQVVDGVLVLGVAQTASYSGQKLALAQSGYLRQYFMFTVFGLVAVSAFLIFIL